MGKISLLVNTLLVIVLFSGPVISAGPKVPANRHFFKLKAINCAGSAGLVELTCMFKPMRNKFGWFHYNLTILQEIREAQVKMEVYTKSSSNVFYPTGIKYRNNNYCTMINNEVLLKMVESAPLFGDGSRITEVIPIPKCPWKGTYLQNITVPTVLLDPTFVPSGDHRWDIEFTSKNGKALLKSQLFVYANGVSFRKT